ncbi:hypothetical protein BDW75DRAFT_225119 [Aspergillus navahoensis]
MTVSSTTGRAGSSSATGATNTAILDLSATPKSDADTVQACTTPRNAWRKRPTRNPFLSVRSAKENTPQTFS